MSEPEPSTPESAKVSSGEPPRVRRISNPRPKKSARKQRPKREPTEPIEPDQSGDPPIPPSFPVFDLSESPVEPAAVVVSASGSDWPEPEPASVGNAPQQEGSKRKRRRKKGKGGGQQNGVPTMVAESAPDAEIETMVSLAPQPAQPNQPAQQRPPQPPRTKADPDKVAKLALKIYLAEVSEEGVALIGDNDARELSRRCFRLAEIFIEEESRRR